MELLFRLLEQYGLWLVFANVLALQLGLPVPAYPTLIAVGAFTARGDTTPAQVVAVATAASLIADFGWYAAGARHGHRILRLMCRLSLSPDGCVRQTESIYDRWGAPSLLVAKFIPGFAAVSTSMAGLVRTPLWKFGLFDALGAVLWSGTAVAIGRLFRDPVHDAMAVIDRAGRWGALALGVALVLYVATKLVRRRLLFRSLRMARVSVEELNAMLVNREQPLIVDVRSLSSQEQGRIPGAIGVDSQAFESSLQAHDLSERMTQEVILYCACPNEASAAAVAKKLMRAGFRRVRPLKGGIDAWIAKGYLVEQAA